LAAERVRVDFLGSDELDCPQVHAIPGITFLNVRGDQRESAHLARKIVRIATYYWRLVRYAATANARILHILWNNKFELFDRTALMAYYRLMGKRIVLTAHNVNAAARDEKDSWINRVSLRVQYQLCSRVFVHTELMKRELMSVFGVTEERVMVIPFGINSTIPSTDLTPALARQRLGLGAGDRTLLFFGQIAPYKGLEHLIAAIAILAEAGEEIRLIVAGKVKRGHTEYWQSIQRAIADYDIDRLVLRRIEFVPDEEVETYFKAADAVVIPYVRIFQSGVPFLAFSFGVPVIATDVGSLREDVVEGTGVLCRPADPADLARAVAAFYTHEYHEDGDQRRDRIRRYAAESHSWATVAERTRAVYAHLLR
jgi:glycosyltransferase involved in cell wall biosynthesis